MEKLLESLMPEKKPWMANIMLVYFYSKYLERNFTLDLTKFSKKYGLKESSVLRMTYKLKHKGLMRFNMKEKTFEFTTKGLWNACYKWEHCSHYGLTSIKYPLLADLIRHGILEQPEREYIMLD
jgi:DNA-binding Lrp family transcriptional regulator